MLGFYQSANQIKKKSNQPAVAAVGTSQSIQLRGIKGSVMTLAWSRKDLPKSSVQKSFSASIDIC